MSRPIQTSRSDNWRKKDTKIKLEYHFQISKRLGILRISNEDTLDTGEVDFLVEVLPQLYDMSGNVYHQGTDTDDMSSSFPCIGDIAHCFINPIYDVHIPKIYNL